MVNILDELQKELPALEGIIKIEEEGSIAVVRGSIRGASREEVLEVISKFYTSQALVSELVEEKGALVVSTSSDHETEVSGKNELPLDEVRVLYQGDLSLNLIVDATDFKFGPQQNPDRMKAAIDVLEVITPLVLDQDLRIIDGHLRLMAARLNSRTTVPVIVLEVDEVKRNFLRLALNRSSEFQRWIYDEVDAFVDSQPQLQPILEPLGFFGTTVLPTSFFSDTILNYTIDPFRTQQDAYRQETNIADWAARRREEIKAKDALRKESRKKKDVTKGMVPLFSLEVLEEDKLPTYDPQFEMEQHALRVRDWAGDMTDKYDEIRTAIQDEKGIPHYKGRLLASEVSDNNKRLFSEYLIDLGFTDDEIEEINDKAAAAERFRDIAEIVKEATKETGRKFISFERWKKDNK